MLNYRGGQKVPRGFYWNRDKWETVTIAQGGGVLPGSETHRYVKLPVLLVLVCGPLMGLVYVVFLPLIGFALLFGMIGWKLLRILAKAAAKMKALVTALQRS
ncbi:MAG: hypothetical protein HY647_09890 [Acidobacteria bacterium]|nr:hypothetical protein [Acidobacteriota bacterium]